MSQTILPPPNIDPTPDDHYPLPRKHWTVRECERLQSAGFLPARWELIDGEIIDAMSQNLPHIFVLLQIYTYLVSVYGSDFVWNLNPLVLSETSQPEPDVWVTTLPRRAFFALGLPTPEYVSLVVEVADATLRGDLTVKANLYARADIAEYWVADIAGRRIVVHRDPTPNGYASVTTRDEQASIAPPIRCAASSRACGSVTTRDEQASIAPIGQANHLLHIADALP